MYTDKAALRKYYLKKRNGLSEEERFRIDKGITANILKSAIYREAGSVFVYVSTKYEINTIAIIENALETGKNVCVPLCGKNGEMSARQITSMETLSKGQYGIPEPPLSSKMVERPELILVPALSCDMMGYRLGYGGGYYDRFMQRVKAECMALCAESRLVERLPHDGFDKRCGWVVTERQVLRTDEE